MKVSITKRTRKAGKQTSTYYLRYTDPISGRRVHEPTGTTRKSIAAEKARDKEIELERIMAGLPVRKKEVRITTADAVKQFLEYKEADPNIADGTVEAYRRDLNRFVESLRLPFLSSVDRAVIDHYRVQRLMKVSVITANKALRSVKAFLRWCYDREFLDRVPKIEMMKEPRKSAVYIPPEHQKLLIEAVPKAELRYRSVEWWQVFIRMALFTGFRRGELVALQWADVDLQGCSLLKRGDRGASKTRVDVRQSFPAELQVILAEWREQNPEEECVFPLGGHMIRNVCRDWEAIRKAAGLSYSLKNCRSTAGTEITQEHGVAAAQAWLGHSTPVITAKHYLNAEPVLEQTGKSRKVV